MNMRALRPVRRIWPQKVRTRLTLIYAMLFFAAGLALLGLTYGLVATSVPTQPPAGATISSQELNKLTQCKLALGPPKSKHVPTSLPAGCKQAEEAYNAGTAAGLQAQRQRALSDLLAFSLAGLVVLTVASGGLGWFMSGRVLRPVRVITQTRPPGLRAAPRRAAGAYRARGRAQGVGRHLRRHARTPGRGVRHPAPVRRQRLTRAAHAADRDAHRDRRDPGQAVPDGAAAHRHGRARAPLDRPGRDHDRGTAHPGRQRTGQTLSTEFTDLATWAEDAIDAAAPEIERLDLQVDTELDPAEMTGDPQLLERMISNLVENAVRHNEPGGWIRLRTGSSDTAVYLQIANSGPYIPDDAVPSLFEPFRSIDARTGGREGVGLGLSIAQSVLTAHRATVTVRSQPAGGLDISVEIPRDPRRLTHPDCE
jgi:Histidine kinase-, DNA gyrase B-, and HSP90-like ATPase